MPIYKCKIITIKMGTRKIYVYLPKFFFFFYPIYMLTLLGNLSRELLNEKDVLTEVTALISLGFPGGSVPKNPPAMQEMWV